MPQLLHFFFCQLSFMSILIFYLHLFQSSELGLPPPPELVWAVCEYVRYQSCYE